MPRLVAPKSAMLPAGQRPAGEQRSLRAPLPAKGAPLRGPQHWLAMTCRNLPGGYVCKNVVPGQIRRWFRIRRKRPCTCKSTAVFSMSLRQTPLQPQARICLLHVIARSKATRQSVSPQKCLTNRCCLGEFVVGSVFAQSIAFRFVLPQELRIATPVCALARNDMQKFARWLRLQERSAGANSQVVPHSPKASLYLQKHRRL